LTPVAEQRYKEPAVAALSFTDQDGAAVACDPHAFIIAGYTGRDRAAVQAHIDELAHQGIAPPPSVPMWYPMPLDLLTTADTIALATARTCGEVEPVLVAAGDAVYLGIGSDHTDREAEREDIARSKRICPKPIGRALARLDALDERLDALHLQSSIDGEPYQRGTFAQIVPLAELFAAARARTDGDFVLFCGTVPLLTGAFRFGTHFAARIDGPALRAPLALDYTVAVAPGA
jgi:4-hydroxyphenylacetate 3-monooxygenase